MSKKMRMTSTSVNVSGTRNNMTGTSSRDATVYRMKAKRAKEAAFTQKLVLGLILLVIVAGVGIGVYYMAKKQEEEAAAAAKAKKDKVSPATETMRAIVKFSEQNKTEEEQVRLKCEEFLLFFPGPFNKPEEEAFAKLQNVFVTVDEELSAKARRSAIAVHDAAVAEVRKERRADERAKKKAEEDAQRAVAEAELREKEVAKVLKLNEEIVERMKAEFEQQHTKFLVSLINQNVPQHFRLRAQEIDARAKVLEAERTNTSQIVEDEILRQKEIILKYKKLVDAANEIDRKILNSGTEFAKAQLICQGEIHFLKTAEKGILTLEGPRVKYIKVLDLDLRERAKLARLAATSIKSDDSLYFYLMMDDNIKDARTQAFRTGNEDAKNVLKEVLTAYFKEKWEDASESKQARTALEKRYGSVKEFKDATAAQE